jgi:glycosyltransferase involved in cell wall biosynthesis
MVSDGGALTVEVGSAEQLTDAIRRLSQDGALRKRLSEEAQRTVFTRYTAEAALNPLLEQYAALLRAHERGAQVSLAPQRD